MQQIVACSKRTESDILSIEKSYSRAGDSMTDIHKNLKKLRLARNLTQENVAQKIGVTRQAISGYESGRTQPGIDLLMKFAEIYEVTLDEILYGKKTEENDRKRIQIVFAIVVIGWILFRILQIVMFVMADGAYMPEEGVNSVVIDSLQMKEAIDLRFDYLDKAYGFESLAYQILMVGGIILLVLDLVMKKPLSMKNKWKIVGLLILVSVGIGIFGGVCAPTQKGNLMLPVYHGIICMILWMLVDIIGQGVKRYQKNHKKTDQ